MIQKKYKTRMVLAFFVSAALFFITGCGQKKENIIGEERRAEDESSLETVSLGRFVEEDVNVPDNVAKYLAVKMLDDGRMQIISLDEAYKLQSHISGDGGKEWERQENISADIIPEGYEIQTGAMNGMGDIYINCGRVTEKSVWGSQLDGPFRYFKVTPNGEAKEFQVQLTGVSPGAYGHHVQLESTGEGDLLIKHSVESEATRIYRYDCESLELVNIIEIPPMGGSVKVVGKSVFQEEGNKTVYYDLETGERAGVLESLVGEEFTAGEEGNQIFVVDSSGIYSIIKESDVMEQLLDGKLTSLGYGANVIIDLVYVSEKELLVVQQDNYWLPIIKRYKYDPDMPSVPINELTVYSLYENSAIRKLVQDFQKERPDIQIVYEAGVTAENAENVTEVIKLLNTEILAGKGPDVLFLGGLPMNSYMEKGILADLSSVIEPRLQAGELYENIVEAYKQGSTYPVVPISFKVPIIFGTQEDRETVKDLEGLVTFMQSNKVKDFGEGAINGRYGWEGRDILRVFTALYGEEWIRDGRIIEEELEIFLERCKIVYQMQKSTWGGPEDIEDFVKEKYFLRDEYFEDGGNFMGFYYAEVNQEYNPLLSINYVSHPESIADMFNMSKQKAGNFDYQLFDTKFSASLLAGVNEKALHKEKAILFIDYLLSESGQADQRAEPWGYGIPVSRKVFWQEMKEPSQRILEMTGTNRGDYTWPDKAYLERFEKAMETLDTPLLEDKLLFEALNEQAMPYALGNKELKDAVSEFKQRMDIYLAE